ncbi:uroporphyrinogen-III synthase [Halochromatium glycolicum]|uniref:Uroporphyrinogen-III synthase n=1 Tax=Halochromatium glycolicum TaxID=85075 RepID=A0AAJ0U4T7_9GAMM|nr:uroporphyrinogen-III synthase [Halochromatium glycolicum]MBK1705279.1 uroporphyrinogen-III synthase [Halochromatium glycolicum]
MKTVLVTRPREQAKPFADALQQAGLRPLLFPTIAIRCLDDWALPDPDRFAGVFFTSANAVHCFCGRLGREAPEPLAGLRRSRVWAVGPATASALAQYGIETEPLPKRADAVHLMAAIDPAAIAGQSFLFLRGSLSLGTIPAVIAEQGGRCTALTVYENQPPALEEATRIKRLLHAGQLDCLSFTSPSTVENFFKAMGGTELPAGVLIAAIGTTTAAAIEQLGLEVAIQPQVFDAPSLAEAIAARLGGPR